ncbi:MAG: hypothetical protein ACQETH_10885 [Candidatus Rifleibacteriota bacterium]
MSLKKLFALPCLFIVVFAALSTAEEAKPQFGYVDVADAVLLHPFMQHFDSDSKRFKLSALKNKKINVDKKKSDNLEKVKKEIEEKQKILKKLQEQRATIENTYTKELQKLNNKKSNSSLTGGLSLKEYNDKRESINMEFSKKLRKVRKEVQKVQADIAKLNKDSRYSSHASHEETREVFALILDDVYEAVDAVAKFYKIPFVFNSSFEFSRSTNNVKIANPMPEFFDDLDYRLSEDPEGKLTVGASLKSWLNLKNNNLVNCTDPRLMKFVLKGGVNMTPAVVDYIYQKHKISKTHRDFMQEFFQKTIE